MNLLKILILIIFIQFNNPVYSQEPDVSIKSDTNDVLIGDQIKLSIEFKNVKKTNVVWPFVEDTIGKIEVLKHSKLDTIIKPNEFILRQYLTVTCFDSGFYSIPSFTFGYEKNPGEMNLIFSQPFILGFTSMEIDTTKEIKDIKGPLSDPADLWFYLLYGLLALLVIAGGIYGYFYWKKRRMMKQLGLDYDPKIPPHVLALEALKQLDNEKLWQSGQIKKYYIRLTDIVRVYMRRQFHINAMEMITPEIILAMQNYGFDNNLITDLSQVFETADFAKFAKYQPIPDENSRCMNLSIQFIKSTIPVESDSNHPDLKRENSVNEPSKSDNKFGMDLDINQSEAKQDWSLDGIENRLKNSETKPLKIDKKGEEEIN